MCNNSFELPPVWIHLLRSLVYSDEKAFLFFFSYQKNDSSSKKGFLDRLNKVTEIYRLKWIKFVFIHNISFYQIKVCFSHQIFLEYILREI